MSESDGILAMGVERGAAGEGAGCFGTMHVRVGCVCEWLRVRGSFAVARELFTCAHESHRPWPFFANAPGVLVSQSDGRTTTYALNELQPRGTFFVGPGADVYNGMVVGENTRDDDLEVRDLPER
jgi:predicted membrane GTPase involved in stress response